MASKSAPPALYFVSCRRADGSKVGILHVKHLKGWVNDLKAWPEIDTCHIIYYLVEKEDCDRIAAMNWKSLDSYLYYAAGFVGNLTMCKYDNLTYLKGKVRASQSSSVLYEAWVCIESSKGTASTVNYEILSGECECRAGLGRMCSHVGSLLFKIYFANQLGYTGQSCTDLPCTWNSGAKLNVEPAFLGEIDFKTATYERIIEKTRDFSKKESVLVRTHIKYSSYDEMYWGLKNSTLGDVLEIEEKSMTSSILRKPVSSSFHNHDCDEITLTCDECSHFYSTFVDIGHQKICKLFSLTKNQNKSPLWHGSRIVRITASTASSIPQKACPGNFLRNHFERPFMGNSATDYGITCEPLAIKQLEECYDLNVKKCGTQVSTALPWLSGSPDGIFNDTLLEVKCPVQEEIDLRSFNIKERKDYDDNYVLMPGGSRNYYMQVQLNLFCSKLQDAAFYIWTPREQITLPIPYDKTYTDGIILRLKKFYFSHYLPRCVDLYKANKLNLTDEYVQFCYT